MEIPNYSREDYLKLQEEMLFYFRRPIFNNDQEVQDAFTKFKNTVFYTRVMVDYGLLGVIDIEAKHWKLCRACEKPFLTMDRRSSSITCYREIYRRYSLKSNKYFNKDYECRMTYKRNNATNSSDEIEAADEIELPKIETKRKPRTE